MNHTRSIAFASALLLSGCGARVDARDTADAAGPKNAGFVADAGTSDTVAVPPSEMETGIDEPPPPDPIDASEPPPSSDPPPEIDCLAGDLPPFAHKPISMLYQRQVGSCSSSKCVDFVDFDAYSCVMKLQTKDVSHSATLPPEDCNAFIAWLGSDLLVSHLRDTVTCFGKDVPGAYESTELQVDDGWANKKTNSCSLEPFVSHRACIAKLRAKYFPGI